MTLSKQSLKSLIRPVHRWLGLASSIIMLIVALTGSILAFEEDGRDHFLHDQYHIAEPGTGRLPIQQMVDTFRVYYPKLKINSIRFKESSDAAFVFFTKERYVFMNPYTARITGSVAMNREFFTVVRTLHTELLMGEAGKMIVHWNVLFFAVICISGLIMWWPKRWRLVRKSVTVDLRTGNKKKLAFELHRTLGFYVLPLMFIIAFSGLFMAFDVTKGLVAWVTGAPMPGKEEQVRARKPEGGQHGHFSIDSAYAYAHVNYPGATETFVTPAVKDAPIRIVMRYPYTIVRRQNTFYFNPWDGSLIKEDLFAAYTAYDKVARSNYNLHTGKIAPLGVFSKLAYCLAALLTASLPVTGLLIWLGKKRKKPIKARRSALEASAKPQLQ